ncbi:MAG: hypothetical protein AAGE52_33355, partial [Myxococcota bacterium]
VAMSLALVCGAIATGALAFASYRERVVVQRLVLRLRDLKTRDATLRSLHFRVDQAVASRSEFRIEEALRFTLEPLIIAGLWDEVSALTRRAHHQETHSAFGRWLAGVRALAELYRGELDAAEAVLAGLSLDDPWLAAVDALRLALTGRGDDALQRIADAGPSPNLAVRYQRDLAEVHALAANGRRSEARQRIEASIRRNDGFVDAVLDLEGPASPIARAVVAGPAGPFRG